MILLLGATGYIGQGFARALRRRKDSFIPLSRRAFDYTRFEFLFDYVRKIKPELVINAADYAANSHGNTNELDRVEMLHANTLLPQTVSRVCGMTNTPWGQVSSGSIYSGAKVFDHGRMRVERDLNGPAVRKLFELHPEKFFGFTELDEPNFSFKFAPCSFYSGTKALAEEAIRHQNQNYIWRLRLPFNEQEDACNFLSQVRQSPEVYGAINSLSHLDDCIGACLGLWERRAPFGIYNITNPGTITAQELVRMIQRILKYSPRLETCLDEWESRSFQMKQPRSDCILDVSKLLRTGVELRNVREALQQALEKWQSKTFETDKSLAQRLPAPDWI
jgi:UDP-glucose 4,6-dehydratase